MVNCNFQLFNSHFRCFPERPLLHEIPGGHPNLRHCHVIRVWLLSQSASEKHNQERKAHKPLHTSWISPTNVGHLNVSRIWTFWVLNKQTFYTFFLLHLYFVLCLNDLDVLSVQRIKGFSIIITMNKAMAGKSLLCSRIVQPKLRPPV